MKNLPFIAVVSFTIASCSSVDKNPNSSQNIEIATDPVQKIVWSQDNLNRPQFDYISEQPELLRTLEGHEGAVLSIDITPDGKTIASGSDDGKVNLWSFQDGALLRTLKARDQSMISSMMSTQINVAFGSDSRKLISVDLGTKIWDAHNGKLLRVLEKYGVWSNKGGSMSLSIAKDSNIFITGGLMGEFKMWDLHNEKLLSELGDYGVHGRLNIVALSPKGDAAASVNWGANIKLWDINSGRLLHIIDANVNSIMSAVFSPNSEELATIGIDGEVKVWNVQTGKLSQSLKERAYARSNSDTQRHKRTMALAYSPDGSILASGGYDGTIRLWDLQQGKLLVSFRGHRNTVASIAFTPDGRNLISGSYDETLKVWRMPDKQRAWNSFVAEYNAGQAGLYELAQLQKLYPSFGEQYQVLANYESESQQKIRRIRYSANKQTAMSAYVRQGLEQYLAADIASSMPVVPAKPSYPDLPSITKGEYEKTTDFMSRVREAEADYRIQVASIDADYERAIANYNAQINTYNNELLSSQKARRVRLLDRRSELIGESMVLAYGKPQVTNTEYDADSEVFYADLIGEHSGFDEKIKISVPIAQAQDFGENNEEIEVEVLLVEGIGGALGIDDIKIAFRDRQYSGELTRENYQFVAEVADFGALPADNESLELLSVIDSAAPTVNIDDYFNEAIKLENDPEAERLLAEIAAEKSRQQALQRERQQAALRQRLEQQLSELRQSSRGVADPQLAQAVAAMPVAEANARTWLLAIGVEDYMVAPDVPFADNSLELMSAVLAKRFGIPEVNRVVLQGEQASGTFIRGNIRNTLSRLGPEDTLYFYYSGHGMPGRGGEQLYLAPRDIVVSAFEDDDFAFATLLGEIQQARVGKVLAFLDTCFSGKAGADELVFQGVAPITESAEQQLPDKMTVFYAGTGAQFANSYDDKGHRLFSYFLAQGLVDGLGTVEDLERYVSANVAEQSRAKGVSYEQTPFVDGRGGRL